MYVLVWVVVYSRCCLLFCNGHNTHTHTKMPSTNLYDPKLFEFPPEWETPFAESDMSKLIKHAKRVLWIDNEDHLSESDQRFIFIMNKLMTPENATYEQYEEQVKTQNGKQQYQIQTKQLFKYFSFNPPDIEINSFHLWQLSKVHELIKDKSNQSFH